MVGVDKLKAELPLPDAEALAHSDRLVEHIRAEIDASHAGLSFERFMELALYAPGLGYYSAGTQKFGAAGDFVTAPELSPLFSRCLARQCQEILSHCGSGDILELGAGSGVMAAELLLELEALACVPNHYLILERSADLRQRQQAVLAARAAHLLDQVTWLDTLPNTMNGIIIANEVLDALPVQRFRINKDGIQALGVDWYNDGFQWCEISPEPRLAAALEDLQTQQIHSLAPGYESEINLGLSNWLATLADTLALGVMLFIDYGYPRREYYHPERSHGTLLCHYRHRAHIDPFLYPGLQDITASVDFSAVAAAAVAAGLEVLGYATQNYFLFGCGLETLLAQVDPDDSAHYLELSCQVKLLTLPSEMGERFQAIALARNYHQPLRGFAFYDQRSRL